MNRQPTRREVMNVASLDIDGVLVTYGAVSPRHAGNDVQFHPPAVMNLNTLSEPTGCKIVISSAWRLLRRNEPPTILSQAGIAGDIIRMTPSLAIRGQEIAACLRAAVGQVTPSVIIDDMFRSISELFS